MDAIVTAGGALDPKHPFYPITHGGPKSMLPIAGKPMVQWVIDALAQASSIEQIIVVGLPPETDLQSTRPLTLLPDTGDMVSGIRSAAQEILRRNPNAGQVILTSSDIPALRGEMVDWLACQLKEPPADITYTVIERGVMESTFPQPRRTYAHLKDVEIYGGDIHLVKLETAAQEGPLWKQLIQARKSSLRLASLLGYDTLFFLKLRQLTLADAQATFCKRLGIPVQAALSPYPEMCMDVDRLAQFEFLQNYLIHQQEDHAAYVA